MRMRHGTAIRPPEVRRQPRWPHRAGQWREQVDHQRRGARRRAAVACAKRRGAHQRRHRAGRRSASRRAHRRAAPAAARGARSAPALRKTARILAPPGEVLVFAAPTATRKGGTGDERLGDARIERMRVKRAHLDLAAVFARLAELEVNDVLVEAGPRLVGGVARRGLVDEWLLYVAPKLLGEGAKPLASLARLTKLEAAPEFALLDSKIVGPDLRLRLQPKVEGKDIDVHRNRPGDRRHPAHRTRTGAGAAEDRRLEVSFAAIAASGSTSATASAWTASASPSRHSARPAFIADVSGETLRVTTLGAKAERRARQSRAGAARGRQPRRSLGVRPRRWHRRGAATGERRAFAARGVRGAGGAGALHRAQGFGHARWREPHRQRGGRRKVRRQSHPAHARSHHARRARRGCARESRNRPAGALCRAALNGFTNETAQQHRRDPRRHRRRAHGGDHGRRGSRERRRPHHGGAEGARR